MEKKNWNFNYSSKYFNRWWRYIDSVKFKLRENHDIKKVHQIVNKKFPILLSNVLKNYLTKN